MTKTENYNLIKKTCEDWGVTDKNQIAYILATAEHESDMFNTWTEYSK
jgi:predicted chitinase